MNDTEMMDQYLFSQQTVLSREFNSFHEYETYERGQKARTSVENEKKESKSYIFCNK